MLNNTLKSTQNVTILICTDTTIIYMACMSSYFVLVNLFITNVLNCHCRAGNYISPIIIIMIIISHIQNSLIISNINQSLK